MKESDFVLCVFVGILILLSISLIAHIYADSDIHISNGGIGGDLTVMINTYEYDKYKYTKTSERVNVEITRYGNVIDSDSCVTHKRSGYCAIPFKLIDGKYRDGQYYVNITVGDESYSYEVWIHKRVY